MYIDAQSTIIQSYFMSNRANFGGGVVCFRTQNHLNISRSLFNGSIAQFGGAIYSGYVTISECYFTNNLAIQGGAIYVSHDNNFSIDRCP